MSIFDHSEQQIAAMSSIANAPPLSTRSLSAPHFQLSNLPQDYFYSNRLPVHAMSQGFVPNSTTFHTYSSEPYQQLAPQPVDQNTLGQMTCTPSLQYTCPSSHNSITQPTATEHNIANNNNCFGFQQSVHPFQKDHMTSSINNLEAATETRIKLEYPDDNQYFPGYLQHGSNHHCPDSPLSHSPLSPSSDVNFSSTGHSMKSTLRPTRGYSLSLQGSGLLHFEAPDEYPVQGFSRHSSLGSLYPLTQSHELLGSLHAPASRMMESVPMMATDSSTSIVSMASVTSLASNSSSSSSSSSPSPPPSPPQSKPTARAKARRESFNPDASTRVFTCAFEECGRLFKRSEHLKRHVRSVHTLEKPFVCPFLTCPKRFSRSDNLNQHIRIHRYDNVTRPFNNFTPHRNSLHD